MSYTFSRADYNRCLARFDPGHCDICAPEWLPDGTGTVLEIRLRPEEGGT